MKQVSVFFTVIVLSFALVACSQNEKNNSNDSENSENASDPVALDVALDTPETAGKGEELTLAATVTQGEEAVEDADEVMFEIWKDADKDNSEMLEATHKGKGVYSVTKTFEEDGTYFVQSHVTARDLHTMPKNKITVGSEKAEKKEEAHAHHGDAVSFHLKKPEAMKANEEVSLTAHLQKDGEPLSGAFVRFEITKTGNKNAQWIETEESKDGEYEGKAAFEEAGKYTVTIHAENDKGLHEHTEETITITE